MSLILHAHTQYKSELSHPLTHSLTNPHWGPLFHYSDSCCLPDSSEEGRIVYTMLESSNVPYTLRLESFNL